MPTYVYKFIDSGETIEIYQAFSDDALTQAPHPSDGKLRPVKKVFTPVGIAPLRVRPRLRALRRVQQPAQLAARIRAQPATQRLARRVRHRVRVAQIQVRAQARQLRRQPQRPKPKLHRRINAARGCH
jgi:hypothetical protein